MRRTATFLLIAALLPCAAAPLLAHAQRLRSPWDGLHITPTDTPYNCPAPPAFKTTLNAEGYYTDKNYSIIDPKKLAAFNEAMAGPTHLGQYTTQAADKYLATGSRAAAGCVYSLLSAGAAADAWDQKMQDNNGVYLQDWLLSGAGVAYLKIRNSGIATPQQDAAIQEWFRRLGAREREYFSDHRNHPGTDAWNNHMYWAGLALATEGVAANDPDGFRWGLAAWRMGINAMQPDGSLVAEMNRRQMALHYQLYALGALVMIAEFGEANGIPMYAQQQGAIHRLVAFDVAGLEDPTIIAKRTGDTQNIAKPYSGLEIGWAIPYVHRFPNPQLSTLLEQSSWPNFWQWGGAPPGIPEAPAPSAAELAALAPVREKIERALDAQFDPAPFLGTWCAEGDPKMRASIAKKDGALVLDNGLGSTSPGDLTGQNGILGTNWQVIGQLTPDRSQLDWTNNTYWMRCVPSLDKLPRLSGQWIAIGDTARPCSIEEHGRHLNLDNGFGVKGTAEIDANGTIVSSWSAKRVTGQLSGDGNHINWDNGTYWTRASVYQEK